MRERGFIAWDTDADVYVPVDELQGFLLKLKSELPEEYEVSEAGNGSSYPYLFPRVVLNGTHHTELHVDIFVLSKLPNSIPMRSVFRALLYVLFRMYSVKKIDMGFKFRGNRRKYWLAMALQSALIVFPSNLILRAHRRLTGWSGRTEALYLINGCGTYGKREIIPRSWMQNRVEMQFEKLSLFVPACWDEYLSHFYGDYLTPKQTDYLA